MPLFTFANNVNTTLASAFSSSATSFTLASSAHLPASIPTGEYLVITLNDAATRNNFEVIYVGTISGATCSNLLRAQEGTAALSWLTGDYAYSAPTAGQMVQFTELQQFPSSLTTSGYKKYPDPNSPTGYFIKQWGNVVLGNGSGQSVTLPIAFPNAFLSSVCSYGASPGAGQTCGSQPGTLSTILIGNATSVTNQIFYEAVGY